MSSVDELCERAGLPRVLEGSLIDDRYKIRRYKAAGHFGYVYEAEHEIFGHTIRRVAFKLLKQPGLSREQVVENFSDALAAARIAEKHRGNDHVQHIVAVLDAGLSTAWDDRGYVVMELVQRDLHAEMEVYPERQLPVGLALDYARQICRGLTLAHQLDPPVVHRDIKPQNILIGSRGEAKVSDFGLARAVGYLSRSTAGAGDLSCQAPESLAGEATTASDVYSVGLTIYEMLTGAHPFEAVMKRRSSGEEAVRNHQLRRREPIPRAATRNPQLALMPDLGEVVDRCLQPEAGRRYRDAAELLAALEDVGRSKSTPVVRVRTAPPAAAAPLDCKHLLEQCLLSEQHGDSETALAFAERIDREGDVLRDAIYIGQALVRAAQLKAKLGRIDEAFADLHRAQFEFHDRNAKDVRVELSRRERA